jgi:hypothetical protein
MSEDAIKKTGRNHIFNLNPDASKKKLGEQFADMATSVNKITPDILQGFNKLQRIYPS